MCRVSATPVRPACYQCNNEAYDQRLDMRDSCCHIPTSKQITQQVHPSLLRRLPEATKGIAEGERIQLKEEEEEEEGKKGGGIRQEQGTT